MYREEHARVKIDDCHQYLKLPPTLRKKSLQGSRRICQYAVRSLQPHNRGSPGTKRENNVKPFVRILNVVLPTAIAAVAP